MYPKQFIRLLKDQSTSLLGATLARLSQEEGFVAPLLLCNSDHRFLVQDELMRAGVENAEIVLEPVARSTAPAVAVASLLAVEKDPAAVIVVMPSDHVVQDPAAFVVAVKNAAEVAARGHLALFGIKPDRPHTGYGYMCCNRDLEEFEGRARKVAQFTEKPDLATAERYIAEGNYFWNSGIFVMHAKTFLRELERHAPDVLSAAKSALAASARDLGFLRLGGPEFAAAPGISIDYAVMEKTDTAVMLPLDVGWSDVGSWSSLWEVAAHDAAGNAVNGDAIMQDSSGCYVHSQRALVTALGVRDLIIVDTPDAVLVADKNRSEEVSRVVQRLKSAGRSEHEQNVRNYRPWGFFETLSIAPRFQVKLLHVKPGGKLSLQMHHHRSEHWIVVQGTARVTVGDEVQLVRENESTYISATQWHRLENPGKVPLEVIEVQIGTYLGEDDIVRSEDVYNRGEEETH
jgi:mannose-1-phosphate guanylyltransferase/mannose-6-phosphate isomerase